MNALLGILLAQRSRLDNLSDAFRSSPNSSDGNEVMLGSLIIALLIVSIWGLSRLLAMRERHRVYDSPGRLFRSLCAAHQLNWSDRWLLSRVARYQRLHDPARLFLEPQRFEEANLSQPLRAKIGRLREIRNRLFAKSPVRQEAPPRIAPTAAPAAAKSPTPLFAGAANPSLDIPPWTSEARR